jgi:zinc transport system substrate-binding protein
VKIFEVSMNKILKSLIAIAIVAVSSFTLFACGNNNDEDNRLTVYTSIYPVYDFTKKIAGNKINVVNLVKPGEEAHHFEPTVNQMAGLSDANLIFINGLGMEHWIEELSSSITNKIVNTSNGVETMFLEGSSTLDPHIWLNINNAKKQMQNIKNALSNLDPNNASYYQDNYNKYEILFNSLDLAYQITAETFNTNTIVVSHNAWLFNKQLRIKSGCN